VFEDSNHQPIRRTIGRRRKRGGEPPTPEDRVALARLARYRKRAPKGVFIYYSAEEMDRAVISAALERLGG